MKTKMLSLTAVLLLATAVGLQADKTRPAANATASNTKDAAPKPKQGSAEFERMKSLVGTWTGKTDMGQGPEEITIKYRLLAGGSVLEERVFEGTPHEMVSMYYDQGGKLALTHYCMFGNRPGMLLKSSDATTIKFDFDATCGINPKTESYMRALTIRFDDANTITTSCRGFIDGKEMPEHPTTLKRVQTQAKK